MQETKSKGHVSVDVATKTHPSGGLVATVTMEHVGRFNAMNRAMIEGVKTTFEELSENDQLRAVDLAGAGEKAFIGGADINDLIALDPDTGAIFITRLHEAAAAIRATPVPVIGRMHGYCLGAGAEIAAACDFRIGDDSFVMGMPEVKVGLPSVIEAAIFPTIVGWGKTREMLLTSMTYDAPAALQMGFLENLVPVGKLDQAIDAVLDHICTAGPLAVRAQKALISEWERLSLKDGIERGVDYLAEAYRTDEPQRYMRSFLDRK